MLFSEPKIPQFLPVGRRVGGFAGFSALQRAENSSIFAIRHISSILSSSFQCSSASRKFLNSALQPSIPSVNASFSALQRAENSSIRAEREPCLSQPMFQCSSASRKFLNCPLQRAGGVSRRVSVLFSEPKIPQLAFGNAFISVNTSFSALQRAENSSIPDPRTCVHPYFRPR